MKYIICLIILAFVITACDQKPPDKIDCSKSVSKMTDSEKSQCGKAGYYSKSPEKKW